MGGLQGRKGEQGNSQEKEELKGDGLNGPETFTAKEEITHFCRIIVGKEKAIRCSIVQTIHVTVDVESLHMDRLHKKIMKVIKEFEKN